MPKDKSSSKSRKSTSSSNGGGSKSDAKLGAAASAQAPIAGFQPVSVGKHCIYLRAHNDGEGRTLFVVNLPTDATEKHLRSLFSSAGPIERVKFMDQKVQHGSAEQDEEMDEDEEEEVEEQEAESSAAAASATQGKRKGKKAVSAPRKPIGPPRIEALPPLDPRHPHELHHTSTSARVVFLDASSLTRALALTAHKAWPNPWADLEAAAASRAAAVDGPTARAPRPTTGAEAAAAAGATAPPLGLDFLLARHAALRPSLEAVRTYVDSAIAHYEWLRAHPAPKKASIQGVTVGPDGELLDADGFTIVQRGGKYGRTTEGGNATGASMRVARADARDTSRPRKKKAKELEDFYRFQQREKKRENLASLRKQFEADKEKVAQLKASRRFNPY